MGSSTSVALLHFKCATDKIFPELITTDVESTKQSLYSNEQRILACTLKHICVYSSISRVLILVYSNSLVFVQNILFCNCFTICGEKRGNKKKKRLLIMDPFRIITDTYRI